MRPAEVVAIAEKLQHDLGINAPEHIDVALAAAHFGLFARYAPIDDEEGRLVRHGRRHAVAYVAERTRGGYKELFTLAHELFHWLHHPDMDDFVRCTGIGKASQASPPREREADIFAAAYLLPRRIFGPLCQDPRPTLHDLRRLSDRFRASLSATGLRYPRFATSACAVVCTRGGRVAWSKRSATFVAPIAKGDHVHTHNLKTKRW